MLMLILMSKLADFLKNSDDSTIKEWVDKNNITVKQGGCLSIFYYNQITTKFSTDPKLLETRGSIWNYESKSWVCRPFDKFFNIGEENAAPIAWGKAKVIEKIDGSIIKVWYSNSSGWSVSTNGTINAFETPIHNTTISFGEYFMSVFNKDLFSIMNPEYTYIFELVGPLNQVVVSYDKTDIYHLATRNNLTGEYADVILPGIKQPKTYDISNRQQCIEFTQNCTAEDVASGKCVFEGVVVFDGVNRVKVKNLQYLSLHKYSRHQLTDTNLLELILLKKHDDLIGCKREYTSRVLSLINSLTNFINRHQKEYTKWIELPDKEKHSVLKGKLYSYIYYQCWRNNKTIENSIYSSKPDFLFKLIHDKRP